MCISFPTKLCYLEVCKVVPSLLRNGHSGNFGFGFLDELGEV